MLSRNNRFSTSELKGFLENKTLQNSYNQLGTIKYKKEGKRIAIVTNSKHEKLAIKRNKTRRILYTLFREVDLPISAVFYVSKQAYRYDFKKTQELFNEIVKKIS